MRSVSRLPVPISASESLQKNVLSHMNYPCHISLAVRSDRLICRVGTIKVGERNHEKSLYSHVSSKMRELAKMLLEIHKNLEHSMVTLEDCIKPTMFDTVVVAVKKVAGCDNGVYTAPSLH